MMPDFDRWREPLAARGVMTSAELAAHLLDNYQIAALPGSVFGQPPSTLSLRLATSYLDMEDAAAAQATLDAWNNQGNEEQFLQEKQPMLNGGVEKFGRFTRELETLL